MESKDWMSLLQQKFLDQISDLLKSTHFSMSRILSLVRSERSVTLLMLLRAAYSSEREAVGGQVGWFITCKIDEEVGAKEFGEATRAD